MPKTSYNLEQKSFVIIQRPNNIPKVPITITTNAKNRSSSSASETKCKWVQNDQQYTKAIDVEIFCPPPPWKQNACGYKVTNAQEQELVALSQFLPMLTTSVHFHPKCK